VLNKASIGTDILDNVELTFGLLISDKLKSLIENFNLLPHKFYEIDVLGTIEKYYWFHYITNFEMFVDFRKTTIEIFNSHGGFEVIDTISLVSLDELKKLKEEIYLENGKAIRFGDIILNNGFPKYDLFEESLINYQTIISEKLKNTLVANRITGVEFRNLEKLKLNFIFYYINSLILYTYIFLSLKIPKREKSITHPNPLKLPI
jgi:hypothetical protein